MNRSFRPQYRQTVHRRGTALWLGVVIGLFVLQPARAVMEPASADTAAPPPGVPGLNQVVGTREFQAGLTAFERKDFALARRHWAPVARLGHADSQFYMGLLHDVSVGVRPDARQATRWYRLAAEQGIAEAQQKLALAYIRGEGIGQNTRQAVQWWLRAARQGNADSQYNLGIIFAVGRDGIARDIHKAVHWWRQAALAGDPMAQYNLGTLYVNGDTGRPDFCLGLHWWRRSQQNGFERANIALKSLQGQNASRQCRKQDGGLQASF